MSIDTTAATDGLQRRATAHLPDTNEGRHSLTMARIAFVISAGAQVLVVGLTAYCTWAMYRVLSLGQSYGWGAIPPEMFPIEPAQFESRFNTISNIQIAAWLVALITMLCVLGFARNTLRALVGPQGLQYGFFWTVATLFIPIVGLYRPWVGFGEIKRTAANICFKGVVSPTSSQGGFSWVTVLLAITLLAGGGVLQGIAAEGTRLGSQSPGLGQVASFVDLLYTEVAVRLFMAIVFTGYLASLLHQLRLSIKIADHQKSASVFE
jgi:hypothetical protein